MDLIKSRNTILEYLQNSGGDINSERVKETLLRAKAIAEMTEGFPDGNRSAFEDERFGQAQDLPLTLFVTIIFPS
jgi:hypothetical protein